MTPPPTADYTGMCEVCREPFTGTKAEVKAKRCPAHAPPTADGLPPLPEPPAGHRWAYRGKAWKSPTPCAYAFTDVNTLGWAVSDGEHNSFGAPGKHYAEAVPIEHGTPLPAEAGQSDELTLAYISIETLKARISNLEADNDALRRANQEPRPASPGWSNGGDGDDEYDRGFNGHGY